MEQLGKMARFLILLLLLPAFPLAVLSGIFFSLLILGDMPRPDWMVAWLSTAFRVEAVAIVSAFGASWFVDI